MVEEYADGEPKPPLVEELEEEEVMPQWLHVLLRTKFWKPRSRGHKDENRAKECMFCLQCYEVFCPHCTHDEPGHRLLKIHRYVYRSAVLVKDMNELNIDVSRIQKYFINRQKGVLLRPMRRSPHFRPQAGAPQCETCTCWLYSRPDLFCSLTCKGKADVSQEDFSGPEAERQYKNPQTNMLPLSEAGEHQVLEHDMDIELETPPMVVIPSEKNEAPPVMIPLEPVKAPPMVIQPEPVQAPVMMNLPELIEAPSVVILPEPIKAPPVVILPDPAEAPPMVILPEPVEAPPMVIPPGMNNSKRNRPRKQGKPQRAPFF